MRVFTKYTTIETPRSHRKIKAPAKVIEDIYKAGYYITTCNNGKYAQVCEYDPATASARYIAPLSYFISDRICGYKDGNALNLVRSNLIYM